MKQQVIALDTILNKALELYKGSEMDKVRMKELQALYLNDTGNFSDEQFNEFALLQAKIYINAFSQLHYDEVI
jgi:hypothetical protein